MCEMLITITQSVCICYILASTFKISQSTREKIVDKMKKYKAVIMDDDKTSRLSKLINKQKDLYELYKKKYGLK